MHNMLIHKKFLALVLAGLPLVSAAQQRSASGPLERIQGNRQAIVVLGQTFTISGATKFAANGKQIPLSLARNMLAANQDLYVEGQDKGNITIATLVSFSRIEYVSGATPVYVLGTVAEIARNEGLIRLGSLQIDSSTMDPELLSAIGIGSLVEVSGVQPLSGGKVVEAELLSIGGSSVQSQSVGGSGLQKQSVGGSGAQLQSVGGSGAQKQSVGGSGVQLQSVGGSGFQKQSVGGSGAQIQSVGGSGFLKQSVGGSGAQVQSVGGSGK